MPTFTVTFTIEVEADSAQQAIAQARGCIAHDVGPYAGRAERHLGGPVVDTTRHNKD